MATACLAFNGATSAVIFDAILHKAPTAPVRLNPEVPADLERIINKALEKERRFRYQSAAEMRADLERLRRDSSSVRTAVVDGRIPTAVDMTRPTRARRCWIPWAAGAVALVALAAAGVVLLTGRKGALPPAPRLANAVQLTTAIGVASFPSWSPDGRMIAYPSDESGNYDIWVAQVGIGQAVNRTADSPVNDMHPRWSPDGQWISFFSRREGGGWFIMPAVGGSPRKIAPLPPAGDEVVREEHGRGLGIVSLSDGRVRRLTEHPGDSSPVWSPDGRWVAFDSDRGGVSRLWRVPASGGPPERLTDGQDGNARWSWDGKQIYFCRTIDRANQVWALSIDSRKTRPVTALTGRRGAMPGVCLAVDEKSIYFNWLQTRAEIWVADIVEPQK